MLEVLVVFVHTEDGNGFHHDDAVVVKMFGN